MFHPNGPTFFELARQALSSTRRGYDLLAPKFDYTPFRTPDFLLDAVAPIVACEPVEAALDVCCGTGAGMRMLRPLCNREVSGIDFSEPMLHVAREGLVDAAGSAELRFVQGDVLRMPFKEEFNLAVCFGALGHIGVRDQPTFVEQVTNVLKPGGRFLIITSPMPPPWTFRYLASRTFNGAMHVRNLLVRPPFIMFYLTFLLKESIQLFENAGLQVETHDGLFPKPCQNACVLVGRKG